MANAVNRYQPQTMTRLPDLIDRLFQESFVMPSAFDRTNSGTSRPTFGVNLYETGDTYVLQAALPGLKTDGVDIQVVGRDLTIKGSTWSTAPENAQWLWRGIGAGEFQESFTLPVEIESDRVQATYENGILSIELPKAEHLRPKNIKVEVKNS